MITILRDDELLESLLGSMLPSVSSPEVGYRIMRRAGVGVMFASFYALRVAPGGESPVVVKVLRPSFSRQLGPSADVVVRKEAVSLGRLNQRVPPTPFVVRLIDVGSVEVQSGMRSMTLPWITIEYVHGGAQGTTLAERVERTIESTGAAFDPGRALRAVECIAAGLTAVHEVGVIHRDLTPERILCSGAGPEEIFKLSDFGLARPQGFKETLGAGALDSEGAKPPEILTGSGAVGPWTDLFGFASVVYFLLTGEPLFPQRGVVDVYGAVTARARRSVLEGRWLHPALRASESMCKSIDLAIRWATSPSPDERLQEAESLAAMLVPYLRPAASIPLLGPSPRSVPPAPPTLAPPGAAPTAPPGAPPSWMLQTIQIRRGDAPPGPAPEAVRVPAPAPAPVPALVEDDYYQRPTLPSIPVVIDEQTTENASRDDAEQTHRISAAGTPPSGAASGSAARWTWSTLHQSGNAVVRSVGWDGYGRCLAATSEGLLFWNGMTWSAADVASLPQPQGIRFVQRAGAGRWLVGGDGATLATYNTGGLADVSQYAGAIDRYLAMSGDLDDIGVMAAEGASAAGAERAILLQAFLGRRWMRPLEVEGMAHLSGLARVDDGAWLAVGRGATGGGMIARYEPLEWRLTRLPAPEVRAFMACTGVPEMNLGIVVGADGAVVFYAGGETAAEVVDARFDLSAVALSPDGTTWVASARRIWCRSPAPPGMGAWTCIWADDEALVPVVSLYVDAGVALVVRADGGVLEGRAG